MYRNPQLYIIAGPNGAGKTTFARKFLPQYAKCNNFVNADLIASGLSPFSPDSAAIRAGKLLLNEIHALAEKKSDFAFETTLSGRTHLKFLEEQTNEGYSIHIFFLWVPSVKLAVNRIKDRVENGGHYVKSTDVKRRFPRSIRNFFNLYMPLADSWYLFENSAYLPRLIAKNKSGQTIINDTELFKKLAEKKNAG
jgi:predicted ABC-type ATPase